MRNGNIQNSITYERKNNDIECIYYKDAVKSYPTHTHANHIIFGFVMDGLVCIACGGKKHLYHTGEHFSIMPDTPHAVEPVNETAYSMVSICKPVDKIQDKYGNEIICTKRLKKISQMDIDCKELAEISCTKRLKKLILAAPEKAFLIEDMAQHIGLSPYHMIRKFKASCGLTPHQFQMQCRVRKAQKLLAEGKNITEAAYAAGFCDQSHFDRCFHKIVRLTPSEYKRSLK